jgi:hypothetical protein
MTDSCHYRSIYPLFDGLHLSLIRCIARSVPRGSNIEESLRGELKRLSRELPNRRLISEAKNLLQVALHSPSEHEP